MTFSERLKALRDKALMTQRELAEKSGVSKASISNLEQGRYAPTWDVVQKLAAALGVDCTAFQPAKGKRKKGGA